MDEPAVQVAKRQDSPAAAGSGPLPVPPGDPQWVAATKTRNWMLGDPLVDWLDIHGEHRGYRPDVPDPRTDYLAFIFEKGHEFERRVVGYLSDVVEVATVTGRVGSPEATFGTWRAMLRGVPVVYQASLADHQHQTFGSADFLIRSDTLAELFPGAADPREVTQRATRLEIGNRHYVVVDAKYSTLHLSSKGLLLSGGSAPAYKAQVVLYNRALGALQGYHPSHGFVLGRGWQQTAKGVTVRNPDSMNRLGRVSPDQVVGGARVIEQADRAAGWIRTVRQQGASWVTNPPSVDELRPNAGRSMRWASAVKAITEDTEDLTRLWNVGVSRRQQANRKGLFCWTDPRVTPKALGLRGKRADVLGKVLTVNRCPDGPAVLPETVRAARGEWASQGLDFYVDFETASDLNDDFARFPIKNGQPLVFMVGCGHMENNQWRFQCFTADDLTLRSEQRVVSDWFEHMRTVQQRLSPGGNPKVFHWSSAETLSLETAWNSVSARHPDVQWPDVNWFDFLKLVVEEEPLVVRGAHGFGLKAITQALHRLGLIDCAWETGPADGLGAMVGAWWCENERLEGRAGTLRDVPLMKEIESYNETDCRAIMEIVSYLR